MSKSVLISIQPKWCELIASGTKTIEVRKSAPKLETPFKCYIYETKDKKYEKMGIMGYRKDGTPFNFLNHIGKVIGEFVCDGIDEWFYLPDLYYEEYGERMYYISLEDGHATCLTYEEFENYGKGKTLYGWHISDLKIYDKPKELSEFKTTCEGIKCDGCEYYYVENNESIGLFKDCLCGCEKPIKKAPQSWGYCEELEK